MMGFPKSKGQGDDFSPNPAASRRIFYAIIAQSPLHEEKATQ
ncbi:MAG TPA: hypothetical protein VLT89_02745 [Usitatibacter sp.]|nr:hypothetical protein [Usitatibacter sp.]